MIQFMFILSLSILLHLSRWCVLNLFTARDLHGRNWRLRAVIDVFRLARVQRNYYEIAFGCELKFFSICEQMIRLLRARHSSG